MRTEIVILLNRFNRFPYSSIAIVDIGCETM
jgi:hypothetical protein